MPMPLLSSKVRYRFFLFYSEHTCSQVTVALTVMLLCTRLGALSRNQSGLPSRSSRTRYPLRIKSQRKLRFPFTVWGREKVSSFHPLISVVRWRSNACPSGFSSESYYSHSFTRFMSWMDTLHSTDLTSVLDYRLRSTHSTSKRVSPSLPVISISFIVTTGVSVAPVPLTASERIAVFASVTCRMHFQPSRYRY